jgi:ABC-type multidrug transport system ATPase subunit
MIGPNGSGKTTVVNLITGFLKPNRASGTKVPGMEPNRPGHCMPTLLIYPANFVCKKICVFLTTNKIINNIFEPLNFRIENLLGEVVFQKTDKKP